MSDHPIKLDDNAYAIINKTRKILKDVNHKNGIRKAVSASEVIRYLDVKT